MNRVLRSLFACLLLTSLAANGVGAVCCDTSNDCNNCCLGPCDGSPFLQIRSQGRDSARELCLWQEHINKYDQDCTYGAFSIGVEYTRSFRNNRLTHFYFGNDLVNCCELFVQGSAVEDRNEKAWLADYFGLPRDYDSRVKFCPEIQNVVIDLNLWLGFDEAAEGLYLRINAPIVYTKWQLCASERTIQKGTDTGGNFYPGYMGEAAILTADQSKSFLQYMKGGATFGDMESGLNYGTINNCDCTKTRLGEIDLSLGWNFALEEDYHAGAFLYVAAPAGNRPCAKRLFEPMVGNGKHWEFGGGFSGSWIFWRSDECEDRYMGVWMEATVAHLFKTCQKRSFDFCNRPNSRYMLLEEMTKDNELKIRGGSGNPVVFTEYADYVYNKKLIPAINVTTRNVDVKIDVQADIALKLGYVRDNWSFDIGYNLWARTGEKFCLDNCACANDKEYAIKGDATIYGDDNGTPTRTIMPLSATQKLADIHGGKNYPAVGTDDPTLNPRVDAPVDAYAETTQLVFIETTSAIKTSVQPILVKTADLNLGKSPSAITHKLFGNIGYSWKDRECCDYVPFIGIGGKVEFAQDNWSDCCCDCNDCCNDCCDDCCNTCNNYRNCNSCNSDPCCCDNNNCNDCCSTKRGGLSQWGIWIKGGVAFD